MANLNFNKSDAPESTGFEPIPAGEYVAHIVKSEMKDTKAGTGQFLELRIQILEPPYQKRIVFDRLNLINPNETAVAIAKRTLAEILTALGEEEVEDSEELHNRELKVVLEIDESNPNYPPSNRIVKYLAA